MLNSIGIPSKGAQWFLQNTVPFYSDYDAPLVISISANTADEFARFAEEVSIPGVAAIEVNISCPNIEDDGKAFAMKPGATADVIRRMRSATDLPLWTKLAEYRRGRRSGMRRRKSRAPMRAGHRQYHARHGNRQPHRPRQARQATSWAGFSGPALKPITLRMTYQCARAPIPVIGCGGIATIDDVLEYSIAVAPAPCRWAPRPLSAPRPCRASSASST